jgi:hypothetical protein
MFFSLLVVIFEFILQIILVSFAVFVYGLIRFAWGRHEKNDTSHKHGKSFMLFGLITLFMSIAIWFYVGYTQSTVSYGSTIKVVSN